MNVWSRRRLTEAEIAVSGCSPTHPWKPRRWACGVVPSVTVTGLLCKSASTRSLVRGRNTDSCFSVNEGICRDDHGSRVSGDWNRNPRPPRLVYVYDVLSMVGANSWWQNESVARRANPRQGLNKTRDFTISVALLTVVFCVRAMLHSHKVATGCPR